MEANLSITTRGTRRSLTGRTVGGLAVLALGLPVIASLLGTDGGAGRQTRSMPYAYGDATETAPPSDHDALLRSAERVPVVQAPGSAPQG